MMILSTTTSPLALFLPLLPLTSTSTTSPPVLFLPLLPLTFRFLFHHHHHHEVSAEMIVTSSTLSPNRSRRYDDSGGHASSSLSGTDDSRILEQECLTMDTGYLYRITSQTSTMSMCADGSTDAGAYVRVRESVPYCGDGGDLWRLEKTPKRPGYYHIINEKSRLGLSNAEKSQLIGWKISQHSVGGRKGGNWCFQDAGNGYNTIAGEGSVLVLDVTGDGTANGAMIQQNKYFYSSKQHWKLTRVERLFEKDTRPCEILDTSVLYTITARHSKKILRVDGDSKNTGAFIVQGSTTDVVNSDKWQLVPVGEGYYNVINDNSGLSLTVGGHAQFAGKHIRQRGTGAAPNKIWCLQDAGDGYYKLIVKHSGLALEVSHRNYQDGARVDQWRFNDGPHQQWLLTKALSTLSTQEQPASQGTWEGPYKLPLVAASAANLPDGRILTWAAAQKYGYNGFGKTYTSIFDPTTTTATSRLTQDTQHDMFCPGTAVLPDTRILITGGQNDHKTTIYDPRTDKWTRGQNLLIGRGYHSMTPLSDGSVFTLGGSWSGKLGGKHGELWNIHRGSWEHKPNIMSTGSFLTEDMGGIYRSDNHMWLFTAPNDLIFHAGPSRRMHWIDTKGSGTVIDSLLRGDSQDSMNGNAVMFDVGMILTVNGAISYSLNDKANGDAFVIDVNGGVGGVTVHRTAGWMQSRRTFGNSVALPSGEVVVVGGLPVSTIFSDEDAVMFAEIWNPSTGRFRKLSSMKIPRTYHSVAILMKDGRVFVSGGGLCGPGCKANHPDAEIFVPPYLSNSNGSYKHRNHRIQYAPESVIVGETFTIDIEEMVNEHAGSYTFALMRLGAVTHSLNNDCRRIPLAGKPYTPPSSSGTSMETKKKTFELTIPSNPAIALPGAYFLFAMDADGVPSISVVISITIAGLKQAPVT